MTDKGWEADGAFGIKHRMERFNFPDLPIWLPPAWIACVVLLSVIVRKRSGKPIVPAVPENAIYADRNASGRWASKCLIVAVTSDAFIVMPKFPMNLMFLPEIYGLEYNIPRGEISRVDGRKTWAANVQISLRDGRKFKLKVHNPAAFLSTFDPQPKL